MAVTQKKTRIPTQIQGGDIVTLTIDVAAGADSSTAFTFSRAFAAIPLPIGLVRVDSLGADVASGAAVIDSLTKTGGTLKLKGTSTVIQTYNLTVVGDYNNPTAY